MVRRSLDPNFGFRGTVFDALYNRLQTPYALVSSNFYMLIFNNQTLQDLQTLQTNSLPRLANRKNVNEIRRSSS